MKTWDIRPTIQSRHCPYKLNKKGKELCGAIGNAGGKCVRDDCPVKVPQNAVEYGASLKW